MAVISLLVMAMDVTCMVDLWSSHALTVSHSVTLLPSVDLFLSLLPVPDSTLSPPTIFPNATTSGNNVLAQDC